MKIYHPLVCILLSLMVTGCSGLKVPQWVPFTNKPVVQEVVVDPQPVVQLPIESGRVISPERLAKGGKILLVPFRAGEQVIASEELDKIAFRLMQGMAEPLRDNRPYFEIMINSEEGVEPDFVIDGYFVRKRESSDFLARWFFKKKKRILTVEGKLMDPQTREVIVTFEDHMVSTIPEEDFLQMGATIGKNIGDFILSRIVIQP